MKYSSVFALTLCGALAFALVGCKYDNPETGNDQIGVAEIPTTGEDPSLKGINGIDVPSDQAPGTMPAAAVNPNGVDKDAEVSSLDQATGRPFDQDPNFERCTDVNFAPVYFGFDASQIVQGEMAKIEAVAQHLGQNQNRVVIIEGNCDERGSNEYNLPLGQQRADAIRDYLLQLEISPDRVQTKSYGEEKPAVIGSGEAVWSKNRRGEFVVFQKKQ